MPTNRQQLVLDEDVQAVLEFMQTKIATCKLVQVAEALPKLASGLWDHYPQEQFQAVALVGWGLPSIPGAKRPASIEFSQGQAGAGDGFVKEACVPEQ